MRRCCSAAADFPNQPSLEMLIEKIGAIGGKFANFAGIDRFVANKHTELVTIGENADRGDSSLVKAADFVGDALHYPMDEREWLILAERDEMAFVVGENFFCLAGR